MIRFLHTSDWQLGMTRHFLSEGAQERFSQARFDAIRAIARIAKDEICQFVVVCGDVFESNQVDRKTVARAMEALKEFSVPVFLLPGNHDPLNAASVFRSSAFSERKPAEVHVIENASPIKVGDEVELVGAPWFSKRPAENPIVEAIEGLEPATGVTRICLAHGGVEMFTPARESFNIMPIALIEQALAEKRLHFVALGDRHSLTNIGNSGRIWYSGTPEPTDFREKAPGHIHVVEINEDEVSSRAFAIGQWRFFEHTGVDLTTAEDVEALRKSLSNIENKERTIVRLNLVGTLTLTLSGVLQNYIEAAKDLFGAFEVRDNELMVLPDDADFANLGFSGFANSAVQRLRAKIEAGGDEGLVAREALMLMLRLARTGA